MPTFDEMVANVMDELNLTSTDAQTRVGKRINERYRQVISAIGLDTSKRTDLQLEVDPADSDFDDLPLLQIDGIEKVLRIQLYTGPDSRPILLDELTYDEITGMTLLTGSPRAYAIYRMGSGSVTIRLDSDPPDSVDPFTLLIEGLELTDELADDSEPAFSSDYHKLLEEGAKADERKKMEKFEMAAEHEAKFEQRLSDLKMFIAKSSYLDRFQGKTAPDKFRPGFERARYYWYR